MSRSADKKTGAAREDAGEVRAACPPLQLIHCLDMCVTGHMCDCHSGEGGAATGI